MHAPQEQPCMPPQSNHACPPRATMHPQATMHALLGAMTHAPPRATTHTPPLTESQTPVKI